MDVRRESEPNASTLPTHGLYTADEISPRRDHGSRSAHEALDARRRDAPSRHHALIDDARDRSTLAECESFGSASRRARSSSLSNARARLVSSTHAGSMHAGSTCAGGERRGEPNRVVTLGSNRVGANQAGTKCSTRSAATRGLPDTRRGLSADRDTARAQGVKLIERALERLNPLPHGPPLLRYHAWKLRVAPAVQPPNAARPGPQLADPVPSAA